MCIRYKIGNLIKYPNFCPRSFFQLVGDLSELREKDYTDLQHSPGTRSLSLSFFLLMALFDWLGGKASNFLPLYRLGSCVFVTVLSARSGYNLQILVVVSEYENIIN